MFKHIKYRKKIRITYIASALAISVGMLIAFPWIPKYDVSESGYYVARLNGEVIGSAESKDDITQALANARLKINTEAEGMTYIAQELDIKSEKRITGARMTEAQLEQKMYDVLKDTENSDASDKEQAYIVNIGDYTVTLASEDEVIELLNTVKSKYDTNNEFQVDLVEATDNAYSYMTTETCKSQRQAKDTNIVAAGDGVAADNAVLTGEETQEDNSDGIKNITFAEDIQVVETYTSASEVSDLQTAIDDVTKDKQENETYIVDEGDCLSSIAEKYNLYMAEILGMNPGLTADSIIGIGDVITVTVPKPELSVVVTQQMTYQESYDAEVQYIYNDSKYTNEQNVVQEGTQGVRQVTAMVTYQDGNEISRDITNEIVLQESSPRVVEVGTKVPPTFIKPLAGGVFTSGFGQRWGRLHKGIDWACPTGTAINASCGGRIVTAGWVSGYGYCVEIAHSDGKHTRYGHLSQILVSVGQTVSQGEKVALSGNTGDSTGPHVHFEIIVNGSQVDPLSLLN